MSEEAVWQWVPVHINGVGRGPKWAFYVAQLSGRDRDHAGRATNNLDVVRTAPQGLLNHTACPTHYAKSWVRSFSAAEIRLA
jgi:hypothetical protein